MCNMYLLRYAGRTACHPYAWPPLTARTQGAPLATAPLADDVLLADDTVEEDETARTADNSANDVRSAHPQQM